MTISILGGSCDLVSNVISTSMGVISIVTLIITLVGPSYYPLSISIPVRSVQGACVAQFMMTQSSGGLFSPWMSRLAEKSQPYWYGYDDLNPEAAKLLSRAALA